MCNINLYCSYYSLSVHAETSSQWTNEHPPHTVKMNEPLQLERESTMQRLATAMASIASEASSISSVTPTSFIREGKAGEFVTDIKQTDEISSGESLLG